MAVRTEVTLALAQGGRIRAQLVERGQRLQLDGRELVHDEAEPLLLLWADDADRPELVRSTTLAAALARGPLLVSARSGLWLEASDLEPLGQSPRPDPRRGRLSPLAHWPS